MRTNEENQFFYLSIEDPTSRTTMEIAISHDDGWGEAIIRYVQMLQGIGFNIDITEIEKSLASYKRDQRNG